MERKIDKLMFKEFKLGSIVLRMVDMTFVLCVLIFAFLIRKALLPIESADYYGFLEPWIQQIRDGGGYRSLGTQISNYTSPYMYIMCFLSYFNSNDLYLLKYVSIFFDYVAGVTVFLIVHRLSGDTRKAILGLAVLLLAPNVILDSAYWCQCDIIYTSFLLLAFYFFLRNDSKKTLIFVGISFAFKLQALFLLPFLVIMWLKKETIRLRDFIYIPVIYILAQLPAWMMGRDFKELMTIYTSQAGYYPWGTLAYPNIYALLGEVATEARHADEVSMAGTWMTIILLGCLAYYIYTKRCRLTNQIKVTLALFSVALIVYSLPHMHERYGFLVDLFAIIYGVLNVKRLPVTACFITLSVCAYMPYLIAVEILPIQYMAIAMLGLLVFVGYDLYRQIHQNLIPETPIVGYPK